MGKQRDEKGLCHHAGGEDGGISHLDGGGSRHQYQACRRHQPSDEPAGMSAPDQQTGNHVEQRDGQLQSVDGDRRLGGVGVRPVGVQNYEDDAAH